MRVDLAFFSRRCFAAVTLAAATAMTAIGASSCGSDSRGACLTSLPETCQPLYTPTFDKIFTTTLHPTCASGGSSCHAASGHMGGLIFEDAGAAYDLLLGKSDGRARVIAGDPKCSILVERLDAPSPALVMPPGAQLSEAERCVFRTWIANGAER